MYFHKQIFKTADVIVSPMTGYLHYTTLPSAVERHRAFTCSLHDFSFSESVTAYTLQDDALNTGELDYINGGKHDDMHFQ